MTGALAPRLVGEPLAAPHHESQDKPEPGRHEHGACWIALNSRLELLRERAQGLLRGPGGIPDGVFKIANALANRAFDAIGVALGLEATIAGQIADPTFDRAFGVLVGAFDIFLVHCDAPCRFADP